MTDYEPKRLKRWTIPQSYCGAVWPAYYSSGVGRSRDSDCLEESNFVEMLKAIGGESETVTVVREGHWAVGWVEWIAIHQDDSRALEIADGLRADLDDYPVLNEDDFSQRESDLVTEYWDGCSVRDRARTILEEVKRYHWIKPNLMRFRRMLRADYYPGSEDGLSRDESMVSRALEETLRQ